MRKMLRFISMYRSYRADRISVVISLKGAFLWCGALETQ